MTNSNNNGISVDLSTYVNALNEVLNSTTRKFTIIVIIMNIAWVLVFGLFLHNVYETDYTDTYQMEQAQPDQSQSFTKGVGLDGNAENDIKDTQ